MKNLFLTTGNLLKIIMIFGFSTILMNCTIQTNTNTNPSSNNHTKKQLKKQEELITYTDVIIGNQLNKAGNYVNMTEGKVYTREEALKNQEKIDFVFYNGGLNFFLSPSEVTTYAFGLKDDKMVDFIHNRKNGFNLWQTINVSYAARRNITAEQFNSINTPAELKALYGDLKIISNHVSFDSTNQVIKFLTPEGTRGMLLVKKMFGSLRTTGYYVVDIKISK